MLTQSKLAPQFMHTLIKFKIVNMTFFIIYSVNENQIKYCKNSVSLSKTTAKNEV